MNRNEFTKLLIEWQQKNRIFEENEIDDDPINQDLDDLGNSMGLRDEDYEDEPEDYDRYHRSAEMLSVDEIVSALESDSDLLASVLKELGIDPMDIPEGGAPVDEDPDMMG